MNIYSIRSVRIFQAVGGLAIAILLVFGLISDLNPSIVASAATYGEVSAGDNHTCAVRSDGSLACWGDDSDSQSTAPTGTIYSQVDGGDTHTCALKTNDSITCWGNDTDGQATAPAGTFSQVSAGGNHTCALKTDDSISCWGDDTDGQATAPAGTFSQVSAGGNHTCALKTDNSITCWGNDTDGQATAPAGTFSQVSAGGSHTCALKTDNSITCWGNDTDGQATAPAGTFSQVSAGGSHTCALKTDNSITCWGNDTDGQATAPAGTTYAQVSAGGSHACALKTDDSITCWGSDSAGQATPPANVGPSVDNPISDQSTYATLAYSYTVPADTFSDGDGDPLTYSASLADDSALPAWLSFNTSSRTFSGTPANANAGTISIKVTADDGLGGTTSDTFDLTITASTATITSFSPVKAASGAVITITGTGFTNATAVSFGGVAASQFTVSSDTEILAMVSSSGTSGDVVVTTPTGKGTKSGFTYIHPPVITNFSPSGAKRGDSVVITGQYLTGATSVKFGNVEALSFTVNSDTKITAVVGNGSTGYVTVVTPGGIATKTDKTFYITNTATITKTSTKTLTKTPTKTLNKTSQYLSRTPTRTLTRTPTRTPTKTYTPTIYQTPTDTPTVPTDAPTPTPTLPPYIEYEGGPVNISITNFTATRWFDNFSNFGPVNALESTIFWIEVRNLGSQTFTPAPDGTRYTISLVLKNSQGEIIDEKHFSSTSEPSIEPLKTLAPGESQILRIDGVIFSQSVPSGSINITIEPAFDFLSAKSMMTRQITIQQAIESCACNSKLVEAVVSSTTHITGFENPSTTSLIEQAQSWTCSGDNTYQLEQLSKWYINQMLTSDQVSNMELIDGAISAGQAIEATVSCVTPGDWLRAFLNQMVVARRIVNSVITESPVYPRVINSNSQVSGFLNDGSTAEIIPESRAAQLGETRVIFYTGSDDKAQIQIAGYDIGVMDLTLFFSDKAGSATQYLYQDIPIQTETLITLNLADNNPNLSYFRGETVQADKAIPPTETISIPSGSAVVQPISLGGIKNYWAVGGGLAAACICLPLLLSIVVAGIMIFRHRSHKKVITEVEGLDLTDEVNLDNYDGLDSTSTPTTDTIETKEEEYVPPEPTQPTPQAPSDEDPFFWELDTDEDQ